LGRTHDDEERCSLRTHNWYALALGSTFEGKPYVHLHGDTISTVDPDQCNLFMRQALQFLVPRKKPAPPPEPETNRLPAGAPDEFTTALDYTQRLGKAEAFIRHCPGSVAGLGTARKYQFAIACKLLGAYKLRLKDALALMLRWGSESSNLYRNGQRQGDGTFRDVTQEAGVGLGDRICTMATFADYDNDGRQDLFVTSTRGGNVLFHNQGDGTFKDVTKDAGVVHVGHCQGAVFFDYDND